MSAARWVLVALLLVPGVMALVIGGWFLLVALSIGQVCKWMLLK